MKPEIIEFDSLKFVGLRTTIRKSLDSSNDLRGVPALWKELGPLGASLPTRKSPQRFVLITGDLPVGRELEAHYYALFEVSSFSEIPKSLVTLELPGGRMAKFRHKGRPETIGVTAQKILSEWLPNEKASLSANLELFIYPPDYDRNNPEGEFDYCLFIE